LIRRKNRKQSVVDDDGSDNEDQQSSVASVLKGNTHTVIRELKLPAPTAVTCLDMAINAKMAMIDLIRGRNVNDSRIEVLNEEIYDLLNKKAEEAMREYERAVLKAT
jgi:D-ribose pyranose/furanose isomerase RbsD